MPTEEIAVHSAAGTLPAFWNRRAVFIANLLGMFFGNEAATRALAGEIGEADSYGGRLLPIIDMLFRGGDNLLVLERAPDPLLAGYFTDRLGLSLPAVEVLPHQDYLKLKGDQTLRHPIFQRLRDHGASWMDGYVTDDTLVDLAARTGKQTIASTEGSHRGNNKRLLYQDMQTDGLPVPFTYYAEGPDDIVAALMAIRRQEYRSAVVKSAIGASGIGMNRIRELDRADLDAEASGLPPYFYFEGACLVQGWVEPGVHGVRRIHSPSVQMFVADDEAVLYDITEQILSDHSIHEGNESPPPYLHGQPEWRKGLLEKGAWAARWLQRQGYRGTASADFLVILYEDGRTDIQICEINARVTGATYPSILARRFLPEGCWLLRNLRFEAPVSGSALLRTLDTGGELFDPGSSRSGSGVLPVNFNFGKDGFIHKGQFLCLAGQASECHRLLERACHLLPCATERD